MIELLLAAERMLAGGDLDHAERLFSQVAEADPRNAIAVVGLAEVASARGDDAGAVATARRALEIDPENAAARRMIDRLQAVAPEPAVQAAAQPEAADRAPIAAEPEPEAAPEPEPEAAPERRTEPEPEPLPLPPLAPVRRSWLDRLLGFFRRG
jgi:fused signal recognition particle receptor